MRQDKDRSGKWLLTHHGDAILRLAGVTGFTAWAALQPETVAPRRLPDGLLEVRFAGNREPLLVLVEIETYPDADVDRQILEDLMLIAVDRKRVPEVVSLVLRPKGNLAVKGAADQTSATGRTRVGGSWPVVRAWELDAEDLFAADDPGLIPWVPLARTTQPPEELMARCLDRLDRVPDPGDRAGLTVVTQILAGLAFPGVGFGELFGGTKVLLDSPVLDQMRELLRKHYEAEANQRYEEAAKQREAEVLAQSRLRALREDTLTVLESRFGAVAPGHAARLNSVADEARLRGLLRLAATCPDVPAFVAGLAAGE